MTQSKQQQPSVGRIVHVYRSGGWGHDNEPRAAVITGVNHDGTVNGYLFLRPRDTEGDCVPSAFLSVVPVVVNEKPGVPFSGPEFRSSNEGYWAEWPPFVPPAAARPAATQEQDGGTSGADGDNERSDSGGANP